MTRPTHCDRCGIDCRHPYYGAVCYEMLRELLLCYQCYGPKWLCESCGEKAGSFVNYWGYKKDKDVRALQLFLQSGSVSGPTTDKLYSSLNNAGYFQ